MPNPLTILGITALTYIAYSATQYASQDIQISIAARALIAMLLTMAGLVMSTKLVDIKYEGHKDYSTLTNRPSLYTFNHRGSIFYARTASL